MTEIVRTDDVLGGAPRIEGRRIGVLHVYEWVVEEGMDPETVASEFDLDLADVYRALAYYYDNAEEMRDLHAERRRRVRESRADATDPPDRGRPVEE